MANRLVYEKTQEITMTRRPTAGCIKTVLTTAVIMLGLSGCAVTEHAFCMPGCKSQTHNTSSLVSFLYPDSKSVPPTNTIPELRVPLRVGLAFLPSQATYSASPLDAAQKEQLLERIRQRFSTRPFISEIVVIPDYYLGNSRGFDGLAGVQRLYNIDLMALVSYDQVSHTDDNTLSLGYLTIVGAYILPGSSHETATLVDLAVVDPATRSLVLRAGGVSTSHDVSTLINVDRDVRKSSAVGFDGATNQMIGNFDIALTDFQADVRSGKANVRVVARNSLGGKGGGGSSTVSDLIALAVLGGVAGARRMRRKTTPPEYLFMNGG